MRPARRRGLIALQAIMRRARTRGAGLGWFVFALALIATTGFAGWRLWAPPEVRTAPVQRGAAVRAVYATGTVEPTVMMPIAPRVAGRLQELHVDEGSMVTRGQVLARLDDTDLERTVDELDARARFAEEQYRRAQTMFERGVGAAVERDRAKADWEAAEAAAARARAQREFMWLTAPADGQILRRDGEIGELIPVNQPVFHLSCCESLRISAEVDEEDITQVVRGQRVLVHADAFPDRSFEATVAEITPMGDPITRTYRVRMTLPEAVPLRIGMTVDTNIIIETREDALLVPATAVSDGKVWLVRDGRAYRQAVRTGILGTLRSEILDGVEQGDTVIVLPPSELDEGARVRPLPAADDE
jgi:RND family efflux transporter MFP subunit